MPSVAERELDQHADLVLEVMWCRAYAKAKQAYDGLAKLTPAERSELKADPLVQQVEAVELALVAEEIEAESCRE